MGTESLYHCLHYSTTLAEQKPEKESREDFVDFSILLNSKYYQEIDEKSGP